MKCRSLLLVACMLVVPLLAMFSHKIPADVRAAVRRGLRDSVVQWTGRAAEAAGPAHPTAAKVPLDRPARNDFAVVTAAGAETVEEPATGLRPISETASEATVPPALVARLADRSRQARDQQSIESRLRNLGAVAFDCQPSPGPEQPCVCSCRIPVDASGQLQRVFQATGPDPATAAENLMQHVAAWRQQTAEQIPPAGNTASADASSQPRLR